MDAPGPLLDGLLAGRCISKPWAGASVQRSMSLLKQRMHITAGFQAEQADLSGSNPQHLGAKWCRIVQFAFLPSRLMIGFSLLEGKSIMTRIEGKERKPSFRLECGIISCLSLQAPSVAR